MGLLLSSRRETEIAELKSQLARMREDWIEEECHRVEAQLALKEARKEIKQLKQVIETMRSSLADKDKGIQKYFVDINIQNRKLESLLQSMELAHSGSLREELCLDLPCGSPEKSCPRDTPIGQTADGLCGEEPVTEEAVDSELLVGDSGVDGSDLLEELVLEELVSAATATQANDLELLLLPPPPSSPGAEVPAAMRPTEAGPEQEGGRVVVLVERAVQTDVVPYSPALSELIQYVLQLQDPCAWGPASPAGSPAAASSPESFPEPLSAAWMVDLTPKNPNSAILLSPVETPDDDDDAAPANRLMRELDFAGCAEQERSDGSPPRAPGAGGRRYWSRSFLVDLLAVAAPAVPTVLWALSTQRGGTEPVYNIGALLRGCCAVALHSLRRRSAAHVQT